MSDSEDSEAAEWEREQMLRGTHSRAQKCQPIKNDKCDKSADIIDSTVAKNQVIQDIEKAEASIESIRTNIGGTRREIAKSERKLEDVRQRIAELEAANKFFEDLATVTDEPDEVLALLNKHKNLVAKLPHDQREMIENLDKRLKDLQKPMDMEEV